MTAASAARRIACRHRANEGKSMNRSGSCPCNGRGARGTDRRAHGLGAWRAILTTGLLAAAATAGADDRADLDRTKIVGNRELPKVLYIVPWKKPLPGELSGRPVKSVIDEALEPIDRDVFRREVRYDAQLQPPATAAAAGAPGAPPSSPTIRNTP